MTPPAAATAAGARSVPRPYTRPGAPRPRRVSGPAHPGPVRTPVRTPAKTRPSTDRSSTPLESGLALDALRAWRHLSRHWALDRLIRGRIWIVLTAFALIGIVTLQLLVLALNADVGRALVRQARLQRENAALSIEGSELEGGERVEALAAHLGMQLVPLSSLRFLTSNPRADVIHAAAALNAPVQTTSTTSGETSATAAATGSAPSASGGATQQSGETGAAAQTTGGAAESAPSVGVASTSAGAGSASPSTAASTQSSASPTSTAVAGAATSTSAAEVTAGASGGVGASAPPGAGQEAGSG